MEVYLRLTDIVRTLYNSYIEKFGEDKVWRSISYTINEDLKFHIDFSYEEKELSILKTHDEIFKSFFNVPYRFIKEKYPY